MLKILLDDEEVDVSEYESYVSDHFNDEFEKEWFSDPCVQRILREIDETEVINDFNLYNETLGNIPPEWLSSGSKGLILIYKENLKINGDRLGDNCIPILLELAEAKDVEISLRHIPKFPENIRLYIVNTDKEIYSYKEFIDEYAEVLYCK